VASGLHGAPHTYVTDRLCFVISGIWWVNSGENFEPKATVPAPAGGFVRRVAHMPHYDGVKKGGKEPAVIGILAKPRSSLSRGAASLLMTVAIMSRQRRVRSLG
jgi:hypothetical protein